MVSWRKPPCMYAATDAFAHPYRVFGCCTYSTCMCVCVCTMYMCVSECAHLPNFICSLSLSISILSFHYSNIKKSFFHSFPATSVLVPHIVLCALLVCKNNVYRHASGHAHPGPRRLAIFVPIFTPTVEFFPPTSRHIRFIFYIYVRTSDFVAKTTRLVVVARRHTRIYIRNVHTSVRTPKHILKQTTCPSFVLYKHRC